MQRHCGGIPGSYFHLLGLRKSQQKLVDIFGDEPIGMGQRHDTIVARP